MQDHSGPEGAFTEHDGERYSPEMRLTKKGKPDRRYRLGKRQGKNTVYSARQRLLILDAWTRSGLSATDFASVCQVPASTLYEWRRRFMEDGPAGLENKPRGPGRGSKLDPVTRRAIVMLKTRHPDWGIQRIHDVLRRSEGFSASPGAIRRVLDEEGYELGELRSKRHPDKPRSFERAKPNWMWQTDLFTFTLKRSNRRVHLVGFMDDHSRFIVGFALHASANGAMVRECLQAAIGRFGAPKEVLTDRGPQYHSWRGTSAFRKLCDRLGLKQILARPRHPQTLGKIERFWATLWSECLESGSFRDIDEARARIGHFVDHYNFQRPHQGIDGLVPADRFFGAASEVRAAIEQRVADNAVELAKHGAPRKPFYLTGRVGDVGISLHAEGKKVVLTREDGGREEVDLGAPGRREAAQTGGLRTIEDLVSRSEGPGMAPPHPEAAGPGAAGGPSQARFGHEPENRESRPLARPGMAPPHAIAAGPGAAGEPSQARTGHEPEDLDQGPLDGPGDGPGEAPSRAGMAPTGAGREAGPRRGVADPEDSDADDELSFDEGWKLCDEDELPAPAIRAAELSSLPGEAFADQELGPGESELDEILRRLAAMRSEADEAEEGDHGEEE